MKVISYGHKMFYQYVNGKISSKVLTFNTYAKDLPDFFSLKYQNPILQGRK